MTYHQPTPNMRVQRTRTPRIRSGRSLRSLCSPLTRSPLGSGKRARAAGVGEVSRTPRRTGLWEVT